MEEAATSWIVAFSSLLAGNVMSISVLLIRRSLKRKDSKVNKQFCCQGCAFRENQRKLESESNAGVAHYQKLNVSKGDNTYQTLTLK